MVQCVTIITSNVPYLKRLLEAFPDAKLMTGQYAELSHAGSLSEPLPIYLYKESRVEHDEVQVTVPQEHADHKSSATREAYDLDEFGTRSTAETVHDQSAYLAALERPAQIHVRRSIDIAHEECGR